MYFQLMFFRWGFWYRLNGKGWCFQFKTKPVRLFSQRNTKVFIFWKFKIHKLPFIKEENYD